MILSVFLFLSTLADEYTIVISTTDSGAITSVTTGSEWSWKSVSEPCADIMNKTGCDAAGCRWTEDYETKCNADTIYGVLEPFSSGYLVELIDADKVYCDSWINSPAINLWGYVGRGFLYFFSLIYLFLGVAICADIFMSAIEVITSATTTIVVDEEDARGTVDVRVWNETVANLTLLALGSSAPEILLALLETISGLGEPAGELGPATIVGSAAFNMFMIIAVCVVSVPVPNSPGSEKDETGIRKITELGVFLITGISSLWAYIWMLICIEYSSPQRVTIEEAILTFLMFPALVLIAWGQDTGWGCCSERISPVRRIKFSNFVHMDTLKGFRSLQKDNPIKKSYLVYRANAIRGVSGKKNKLKESKALNVPMEEDIEMKNANDVDLSQQNCTAEVGFLSTRYAVRENEGVVKVAVKRSGFRDCRLSVEYETQDGDATGQGDDRDYVHNEGTLIFSKGEELKTIDIVILEDELVEADEKFYVVLKNPLCMDQKSKVKLGKINVCDITIIDVSDPGQVGFVETSYKVPEDCGDAVIPLERINGSMGWFKVDYITQHETATPGQHYEETSGTVEFKANEVSKQIMIPIIDTQQADNKRRTFKVILTKAYNANNQANLTENTETQVVITNSIKRTKMAEKLKNLWELSKGSSLLGSDSWHSLFVDAAAPPSEISCLGYFVHTIALPWKLLLAFIPPTSYAGGWLTFWCSLAITGTITFVIGEMAETFACMIGVPQSFAAITLVALGTSMPDTFASRMATQMSPDADAAICNVTGSNSVNVFLGLGLPWCVASFYAAAREESYQTPSGNLIAALGAFIPGAVLCMGTLLLRRKFIGGELGGPMVTKWSTSIFFFALWVYFIAMAAA